MTDCERLRELMPWYVTGKLGAADAAAVAAHIQTCEHCRQELSEVVWVRHLVHADRADVPAVPGRVWRKVLARAGLRDLASLDIGSLLVGLRLGVNAQRTKAPVRASLRVMGRNVRVVDERRGTPCKTTPPDERAPKRD